MGMSLFGQDIKVDKLTIQGNKKLKSSFLEKISAIKPGVKLDSVVLETDIKRIIRLPSVSYAYYQVVYSQDDTANVVYNIEENFTLIPQVNAYTTNKDEFAYRVGLYEFNLLGQNIAFGGFYQKDIYSSYAINFRAPYLFSNRFGLAVNHQNLVTLEPVYFDEETADYRYQNNAIEALGLYEIDLRHRVELGFSFFTENYDYQSGVTNTDVPQSLEADKHMIKGIFEYNNLDYYYQYVSGNRSLLNVQYVGSNISSLPDFFIAWNDFFYFKRVGEKGNWANRLRLGLSSNDDSPFAPFSVDNNVNIRGVGNTIDRGTASVVLNTEYRYTVIEKDWFVLQGNAFVDSGTWRNPGGDLSDLINADNIKVYTGLGIRLIHKRIFNAIFRIDYGVGLTKDATKGFVFGIGQYF
ncbi:MAG: outer membrane protein assembly factor [Flavobacteriaceae bacterium]|nr:outer membrane protein assembly factor [Flavobacteriaceae bacterium]